MAFVTSSSHAIQFNGRPSSTFCPLPNTHAFSKFTLATSNRAQQRETTNATANLNSQQDATSTSTKTTTIHSERASTVVVAADRDPAVTILKTPKYNSSVFTFVWDLIRQHLRNIELSRRYGSVYRSKGLLGTSVVVADFDAISDISRNPHLFVSSNAYPAPFYDIIGTDVLSFIDGDKHKKAKSLVSSAFLPSMIPLYQSTVVQQARIFLESLSHKTSTYPDPINVSQPIKEHFLDLIIKLTTNTDQNAGDEPLKSSTDYNATSKKLASFFIDFSNGVTLLSFQPGFRKGIQARDTLEKELTLIVRDRLRDKATRARIRDVRDCLQKEKVGKALQDGRIDFMSMIIASSSLALPDEDEDITYNSEESQTEIRSVVTLLRFLWFAGFSTQSSALVCVIMEIFSDAKLLKRLQDEQSSVPEVTTPSVLNDMPLLSSVLTESMRLHTTVPVLFRRTTEDVIVLQHLIPKETVVLLDYMSHNANGKVFHNPDEFIPDRFVGNADLARKVILFGGFGSSHFCAGASLAAVALRTTLAIMLREYDIEIKPLKTKSIKWLPETAPREGVWIRKCARKD